MGVFHGASGVGEPAVTQRIQAGRRKKIPPRHTLSRTGSIPDRQRGRCSPALGVSTTRGVRGVRLLEPNLTTRTNQRKGKQGKMTEWTGKYLTRATRGKRKVAHLWNGDDTVCRMWSTGGMLGKNIKRFTLSDKLGVYSVCFMCQQNLGPKPKVETINTRVEERNKGYDPAGTWLRNAIRQDVEHIATDKWFSTPATVEVEVDRRLAGMEQTRQYVAKMKVWRANASKNIKG
jgi:hypothetical protein